MKSLNLLGLAASLLLATGSAFAQPETPPIGRLIFTDGDIQAVNADGSNLHALTDSDAYDTAPSWSPDGKQIAYISNLDGNFYGQYALLVMDENGQSVRQLAEDAVYGSFPEWSPDGSEIAYLTQGKNGDCVINVVNVEEAALRELARKPHTDCNPLGLSLEWSPDGLMIAFDYDVKANYNQYQIFAVSVADGTVTQLTHTRDNERYPRWSPDGSQIAFVSTRDGNSEIYVMDADGGNVRRVTRRPGEDGGMSWFPDGQTLVFSSYPREYDLFTIDMDGLNIQNLTADLGAAAWAATLSPDGTQVVFAFGEVPISGPEGVAVVNTDGSNLHTILDGTAGFYLSWWPTLAG